MTFSSARCCVSLNREIILVSTNSNSLMISGRFQDKYICYVVALKSVFAPWWQLSETRTPAALRHPSAIIPMVDLWGCHAISQRLPEQKLIFYRSSPGNRDIPITSLFLDQLWELSFTSCHLSAAQSIPRLNVFAPAGKNAAARLSADRSLIFRNNNQGHKVPERFVPEPFCWGKRAVITGIHIKDPVWKWGFVSAAQWQQLTPAPLSLPPPASLTYKNSKGTGAVRGLNCFDYYKVFLTEYLFNTRLCFH